MTESFAGTHFKLAAELQDEQAGDNPTLIRIDINAGHGAGKSVAASIQKCRYYGLHTIQYGNNKTSLVSIQ